MQLQEYVYSKIVDLPVQIIDTSLTFSELQFWKQSKLKTYVNMNNIYNTYYNTLYSI